MVSSQELEKHEKRPNAKGRRPPFIPLVSPLPLYHIPLNARRASLRLSAASARQPVSNSISRQLIIPRSPF